MEWSKLKTVILLMLAGVNLLLLGLVGVRVTQGAFYEDETRQAVIQVLERGGISFLPEQIPEDITLPPLTLTRSRDDEADIARLFLGPTVQTGESDLRPSYTGTGGTAEFSMNGSFTIALTGENWICPPGQDIGQASRDCLEQMGFQAGEEELFTQGDTTWATYCQMWEGAPVFSCQVSLTWSGSVLTQVEGSRLSGESAADSSSTMLSTPTVLMRFLAGVSQNGYICSQIRSMEDGYLASGSTRSVQLTPVWRISTDTGDYFVDAVTGTVTPDI